MKVVCDTGALITLEKLKNGYSLIRTLYDKIIIPPAVLEELTFAFQSSADYLKKHNIENLVVIIKPELEIETEGFLSLHQGEKEAIQLAKQLNLTLLIEEKAGRLIAENSGIQISGIAGQILKLYHLKRISKVEYKNILGELFEKGRLSKYLHQNLLNKVE